MHRMTTSPRSRAVSAVLTVWVVFLAVACSTISPERPQPPELGTLRVAVTRSIDGVPLRLGIERGLFERRGLNVRLVEVPSQDSALTALIDGKADVALACNLKLLKAAASGAAIEMQSEAHVAGPNSMALVALPGHGYDEPTDKRAPVIAVEPNRELGKLAVRSRLAIEGVDPDQIEFVPLRFDAMVQAMRAEEIDAVWMTEPQISQAQTEHGAEIVTDAARGALLEFPMSSFAAMRKRTAEHPRTFTLFRQALTQAQQLGDDPSAVRAELARLARLDKATAALISVGTFPTSANGVRLQRVADLMHKSGVVTDRIDAVSLLPPEQA